MGDSDFLQMSTVQQGDVSVDVGKMEGNKRVRSMASWIDRLT